MANENEKILKARFKQKVDTTENWEKAGNNGFIPLDGEIIYYRDEKGVDGKVYCKVGDGITNINDLPFENDSIFEYLNGQFENFKIETDAQFDTKQDKLVNNTSLEVVPVINRNSDTVTYRTISQGAGQYSFPVRTRAGALRSKFDKDFYDMLTEEEKNQQVVNLGYLNERLQGLGGGKSIYRHLINIFRPYDIDFKNCGNIWLLLYLSDSTPITNYEQILSLKAQIGASILQNSVCQNSIVNFIDDPSCQALAIYVFFGSDHITIDYTALYPTQWTDHQYGHMIWSDLDNITITDTVTEV